MSPLQFDPFGEPVAQSFRHQAETTGRAKPGPRPALRAGTGLFWVLVIGIVAARAAYFDPDFAGRFGAVAAVMKSLQGIFAA